MSQNLLKEQAMVSLDAPAQGAAQLRQLRPQLAKRQLRQRPSVLLPPNDRRQHVPPAHTKYVGGDAGQLEVGGLQDLMQTVDLGGMLRHQGSAVAGHFAQLANRRRRNE